MARKTKKQQKTFEDGIKALLVFIAIGSYLLTENLQITIFMIILAIALIVVITILQSQREKEKLRKSGILDIDQMDGFQFEYYLEQLFKSQNYKTEVTASRGDYGADLVLQKNGQKIVVQAKRYSKPVGIKAIQEVAAAKSYYNANESWVVCNNSFTKQAINMAKSTDVKLIDREKLIEMILQMNPNAGVMANQTLNTVQAEKIRCNSCGGTMSVKKGKYGRFYGCDNYPKCNNTKKI